MCQIPPNFHKPPPGSDPEEYHLVPSLKIIQVRARFALVIRVLTGFFIITDNDDPVAIDAVLTVRAIFWTVIVIRAFLHSRRIYFGEDAIQIRPEIQDPSGLKKGSHALDPTL